MYALRTQWVRVQSKLLLHTVGCCHTVAPPALDSCVSTPQVQLLWTAPSTPPPHQSFLPYSRHVPLDAVVSRATESVVSQLNEASKQNSTVEMKKAITEATLDLVTDFLWGKRLVEELVVIQGRVLRMYVYLRYSS